MIRSERTAHARSVVSRGSPLPKPSPGWTPSGGSGISSTFSGGGDALGQLAAAQQHDAEALGEPLAQRVGAHQVAEADRVLAVEEQRRLHAATSAPAPRRVEQRAQVRERARPERG